MMKAIKEAIGRYVKQLNKIFPFIKTMMLSTIILLVIFAIDIYDIPSQLIIEQPKELLLLFALAGLAIVVLCLIQGNILSHIKMPIINSTDRNIACITIVSIICSLVWNVSNGVSNYKTIAAFALLVVCIVLLILRIYFYNNTFKSPTLTDKNIFDLMDIYNNSFEVEENKPILITEKDTDAEIDNLRNFKRLINSAFPPVFTIKHNLNRCILLVLETIRFLEPALYDIIRTNHVYFISHHKEHHGQAYASVFNSKKASKDRSDFFSKLFDEYPAYKDLLACIFPYQINSANLKALHFDEEKIDAALEKCPPRTESEHFVLDVYQKYKNGEENIFGECGVNSHTEIKIKL